LNLPFKPYASVATAILLFGKTGSTESVWFYRLENDGFNNDSVKSEREGDEIPELISLWNKRLTSDYSPQKMKHKFVNRADIVDNDYDLCERVYLSGYKYPEGVPLVHLDELFDIQKGNFGAAQADGGEFPFVTTSEELKRHSKWTFDCEAICVPTVSATGHGHASIKRIHYVSGKFSAATITAVMVKKPNLELYVPYVYYYSMFKFFNLARFLAFLQYYLTYKSRQNKVF
jgi:hypothetical protein